MPKRKMCQHYELSGSPSDLEYIEIYSSLSLAVSALTVNF